MSADFCYLLRVRYAECDAQKVVFNARYGEYVDLAVTEFLRAIGFGEAVISGALDYQLVRQTLEWRAPARFDEVLALSVHCTRLGTTSFTLAVEFRRAGADALIATAETVYVMVDAQTLTKQPLPAGFRQALARGGAGLVTDHAAHLACAPQ